MQSNLCKITSLVKASFNLDLTKKSFHKKSFFGPFRCRFIGANEVVKMSYSWNLLEHIRRKSQSDIELKINFGFFFSAKRCSTFSVLLDRKHKPNFWKKEKFFFLKIFFGIQILWSRTEMKWKWKIQNKNKMMFLI